MKYRTLGKTDLNVSVVGSGTWQFGGEWGRSFSQDEVNKLLGSCAIPGCKTVEQVEANARAADLDIVRDSHPQARS